MGVHGTVALHAPEYSARDKRIKFIGWAVGLQRYRSARVCLCLPGACDGIPHMVALMVGEYDGTLRGTL